MGMYTEFVAAFELRKDVPEEVVTIIDHMLNWDKPEPPVPKHPFFACDRWRFLFTMDSYYFAGQTHSEFKKDDITGTWFLTVRSNLKNYCSEIEKFCEWISPYSEPQDIKDDETYFVGYSRYEENDEPTLIYLACHPVEVLR